MQLILYGLITHDLSKKAKGVDVPKNIHPHPRIPGEESLPEL